MPSRYQSRHEVSNGPFADILGIIEEFWPPSAERWRRFCSSENLHATLTPPVVTPKPHMMNRGVVWIQRSSRMEFSLARINT